MGMLKQLNYFIKVVVLTELVTDIYKPIGHWKIETNGTYAISSKGKQTFIEYALPSHVPN